MNGTKREAQASIGTNTVVNSQPRCIKGYVHALQVCNGHVLFKIYAVEPANSGKLWDLQTQLLQTGGSMAEVLCYNVLILLIRLYTGLQLL